MSSELVVLSDILEIKHGYAFKGEYFSEVETSNILLTPGNFLIGGGFKDTKFKYYDGDIPQDYILKTDDIIVTMTDLSKEADTLGFSAKVPKSTNKVFLHNQRIGLLIFKDNEFDKDFIYWLFRTREYQRFVAGSSSGATVKHTSPSRILEYKYKFPPLKTQQKIASLLSNYDKLIENNTQRIKLLESMAEELYKEWFVRLRFPEHERVEVVDGLPVGWKKIRLGDIYNTSSGGTPSRKKEENFKGNIPWVKTGELKNLFILDTDESISEIGLKSSSTKLFPSNTVIIAMYCAMPELSILVYPSATNQACCALLPRQEYIHYSFSYMFIKYAQKGLISHAHGAAQQNLSQEIISEYKVVFPSQKLLLMYQKRVEVFFEEIKLLMLKNQTLKQTRDLLLPRLMSGKLNVEDLDII